MTGVTIDRARTVCPCCASDVVIIRCPACGRLLPVAPGDTDGIAAVNDHFMGSPQCQAEMALR